MSQHRESDHTTRGDEAVDVGVIIVIFAALVGMAVLFISGFTFDF